MLKNPVLEIKSDDLSKLPQTSIFDIYIVRIYRTSPMRLFLGDNNPNMASWRQDLSHLFWV
jgi:hypothetical protein